MVSKQLKFASLSEEDVLRKREAILIRVRMQPGISEDRCAMIAGFAPFRGKGTKASQRGHIPQKLLEGMAADGLIRFEKHPYAMTGEPRRVYLVEGGGNA